MCVRSFQICQSLDEETETKIYEKFYGFSHLDEYLNGSRAIKDLGPEFIEDVQLILEKFDNNTYVTSNVMKMVSNPMSNGSFPNLTKFQFMNF